MKCPYRLLLIAGLIILFRTFEAPAVTAQVTQTPPAQLSTSLPTSSPGISLPIDLTPTPSAREIDLRLGQIENRLNDMNSLVDVQSNAFDATVSRMESNLNLLLTILALVSLLVAILGFGIVRVWIKATVEDQLKSITSKEIARITQEEVDRVRREWEPKFAELYDEYRRSLRK